MCGIIAANLHGNHFVNLSNMLGEISHRGPDDSGTYISDGLDCHLGQVRLSVMDLSSRGHQPMFDCSRNFVVIYNGEVYNYIDLKKELNIKYKNIKWKSNTDTEVIVEGFAREGVSFFDKLNGIFSIIVYDIRNRLMHVLRDPLGIKPLFYTNQEGFYFSSELKALLKIQDFSNSLNLSAFSDQLAFMYIPEPKTFYSSVKKVEPGICFTYKDGKLVGEIKLFKHLDKTADILSIDHAAQCFLEAFDIAVDRQLMSDVPVSLFLSGGLDSSAIAYRAVSSGAKIDAAYTISFSDEDRALDMQSDDLYYAKLMSNKLGIDLHVIKAERNFLSLLPEIIQYMEDGFSDPAAINTYLIAAEAQQAGVKVMLSGQGADEYLAGYRRYFAAQMFNKIPSVLYSAISMVHRLPVFPGRFNALSRRIKRFAKLISLSPAQRMFGMYSWTSKDLIDELLLEDVKWEGDRVFEELFDTYSDNDIVTTMMKVDHHYDLLSLNLTYTDRMSMASGIETRVPFLDFDLIKFMNSIPVEMKLKGRHSKYVFKKAMESRLPKEVIYREKAGFGLPLRSWLRQSNEIVDYYLDKSRLDKQGIFNSSVINRIINEQDKGADHVNTIFTLLCQQIWLDANSDMS